MRRREFITVVGSAAVWPLVARAQLPAMPVIEFIRDGSADARYAAGFRKGLSETGYVEGQNVTVEYNWLEGKYDRLPELLLPNAVRIAVLVNPGNASVIKTTVQEVQKAAPTMGLQTEIINATTVGEINKVFTTLERERPDALFVAPDSVFTSRRVQLVTLAASGRIPATYPNRDYVEVGGLMSYGPDFADMFRQVGVYTGSILTC